MATLFHLRAWWATLDSEWQKLLMQAIEATGAIPNEQELFEISNLQNLFMNVPGDHDDPADVEMFELQNLAPLRMLTNLESLTIQGKVIQVHSIDPIKDCIKLKYLSIHGTDVIDISALRTLVNLESISLNRAKVMDLTPLANLPKLRSVNAIEADVSSLQPLSGKLTLATINIWGPNLTQQAIEQFARHNPHCEVNPFKQALEDTRRWNEQFQYDEGYDFDEETFDFNQDEQSRETDEMARIFNIIEDGLNGQIAQQLRLGNVYKYRLMLDIEEDTYEVIFDYINQRTKIHSISCASWEYDIASDNR